MTTMRIMHVVRMIINDDDDKDVVVAWYLQWCSTTVGEYVVTVRYLLWCSTNVGEDVVMVWYLL